MSRVAAIIVCFHPDGEQLSRLVTAVAEEVNEIIIFNNGGLDEAGLPVVACPLKVESRDGENLGVATALNLACEVAWRKDCRYAVTFDQDSQPDSAMIPALLAELQHWTRDGGRVAAIGPQLVDVRDGAEKTAPFLWISRFRCRKVTAEGTQPVSLLITSGCLLDLDVWKSVARFDDALFIDFVDHNWCWRVAAQGYVVLGTTKVRMVHELSDGVKTAGGATLTMYGPTRRYFQCRNAVYHLFHYPFSVGRARFELRTIAHTLLSAALADTARWPSLWQCLRGLGHGVGGRLGPFRA